MIIKATQFDAFFLRRIDVQKRTSGNPSGKGKVAYKDIITAFDIETTRLTDIEQSIMYVWQWQFGDGLTIVGRTWAEFLEVCKKIKDAIDPVKLVVYVHNLSYEFSFLKGVYDFQPEEVFAVNPRKVLKCEMLGCIEFRCSYLHSNMNLDTYTKKMGVKHQKLTGTFDYDKIRYPWTPLTEEELAYCVHDVQGLVEALIIEMKHDKDTLYKIPLTSTGYVRRDAKKAMQKASHQQLKECLPDYDLYKMLREAFRGGNTHANRFYTNYTIHNVHSADRSSSYPDVQCNCRFPMTEFYRIGEQNLDELERLIKKGRALIMRVKLWNLTLRRYDWGCPYLSLSKCRNIHGETLDNGRILSADYLETTITDIDLKIILDEYKFENCKFEDVAYSRYGYLPRSLVQCITDYYHKKTELKGVEGQELLYMKSKNKLNSLYGMSAQDPVKQDIEYFQGLFHVKHDDEELLLEQSNKRAFLSYAWGVWVTAWARYRLEEGIKLAHGDINNPDSPQFIYCDTDSVKYTGFIDWASYNKKRISDSTRSKAFATDPQGLTHYMGVYEPEHDMCEFRTMGAKKYVYRETAVSPLVCTIAGVSKSKGGKELEKAGGIEAFKSGFIFKEAGGLEAVYNDFPGIGDIEIEGHKLTITSNVMLKPSTYTLGLSADYERLLTEIRSDYDYGE